MSLGSRAFSRNALLWILVFAAKLQHARAAAPLKFSAPTNAVVCNTTTLTWTGGTAPYTLAFDINGETLETAVVINDYSLDWGVDVGPGYPVIITLSDSNQQSVTTPPFTTKPGNETCDLVTPSSSSATATPTAQGSSGQFDGLGDGSASTRRTVVTASAASSTQSTNSTKSTSGTKATGGSTTTSKGSGPKAATIVIAIVVVVLIFALCIAGFFLWRRSKRRRTRAQIDLLAESSFPRPLNMDMTYGRQPLGSKSFDAEPKPMVFPPQTDTNYHVPMSTPYRDPSPPIHQPTYSEKVAMMRRPKGAPEPVFTTNRAGELSGSSSVPSSSSNASVVYTHTEHSSSAFQVSSTRRPKHHDYASAPSIRTTESEASEIPPSVPSASTTSLIPSSHRREADAGVRLAGGPRESWFVGSGTLPPAYGDF